jgi:hypothetical protein
MRHFAIEAQSLLAARLVVKSVKAALYLFTV